MAPTRIPEGSVFVPGRSVETATALLEAADKIKADRKLDVRTVTGGYHVTLAVAEEYQKAFPDAELQEAEGDAGNAEGNSGGTGDQSGDTGDQNGDNSTPNGDNSNAGDDTGEQLEPLPVTVDNTRDEIDAYGAGLDPKVDTTKAANKAEAIALLEEARKPQNPAE